MELSDRIKLLRNELKMTQDDFGSKINLTKFAISNYENGRTGIPDRVISDIIREFNVNESWIRTGEGSMFVELPINNVVATTARFLGKKDPTFEAIVQLYAEMSPEDREAMMKFGFYLKDKFGNHGSDEDSK